MKLFAYLGLLMIPSLALAQATGQTVDSFQELGGFIIEFINRILVPLIFALAFVVFIFGIFKYFILGGSDEKKRAEGLKLMLYGIIGIAVMISVWGLVRLLTGTVGLNNATPGETNQLPQTNQIRY